ncbi:Mannitol dehydrogenase domain protein [Beutenbergia cavernae DSM 12333]|uniref:Mannitol-1-phosphate 5-dehydrogenase n=1 Tax=Beutenbergia cavernae (strain ATCC BAA-8 / DSM 12333 / CCUG 43141 / JCM 11478 / NBRC 16432 / NCIMB 13614 / HKI 0122) TaxID=471853 RepID=C5BXX0_BEUC1|nr:mannitol dehydrogenase family protein [Beutenbergia cavernae]ACQ78864.1 Mannitol dehydrogenase domain protein [Beutenbergia cavernae DSM 12333]
MSAPRLTRESARGVSARPGVRGPLVEPAAVGVVHLGIGAFHRAHQAVYTERAAALAGEREWGILGVTGRRPDVARVLDASGGVYGVLVRDGADVSVDVVGAVVEAASPDQDAERVVAAIAAETTAVVSLTITEHGYAGPPFSPPIELLVRGLRRRAAHGAPLSVLSCDNLVDNGAVLRRIVRAAVSGDDGVARWVDDAVRFPRSMVDRIVPATTAEDRRAAAVLTGFDDAGLVVAEPFSEWVIEDDLAERRPRWELAGARVVPDVEPYERLKLRTLNATHSLLAYEGEARGHTTIAEALDDDELARRVEALMAESGLTLEQPPGIDVVAYRAEVLRRFRNRGMRHTVAQIGHDGSRKLPIRVGGTIGDLVAQGVTPDATARVLAAWAVHLRRGAVVDPLADELQAAARAARDAVELAELVLRLPGIVPDAVAGRRDVRDAVAAHTAEILALA